MNKLKKWFKENITATDWVAIFILLLAVIGVFYLPHWVTQKSWKYDLGETESNEIADTIGGILGPFISFISACLVYLALREQVKANRLIGDQFLDQKKEKSERVIFEEVIKELDLIIEKISNFSFQDLSGNEPLKGEKAFQHTLEISIFKTEESHIVNEDKIEEFNGIYSDFIFILELFNENIEQEESFIKILNLRIDRILYSLKSENMSRISNPIQFRFTKNNYWKLEQNGMFEEVLRCYEVVLKIKRKLKDEVEINFFSNIVKLLSSITEDRKKLYSYKKKLIAQRANIESMKRELENAEDKSEYALLQFPEIIKKHNEMEVEFKDFLEKVKNKVFYDLTGFEEFMGI